MSNRETLNAAAPPMMSDGFPNLSDPGPAGLESCRTNPPESQVDVPISGDLTAELIAYQEALASGDAPGADSQQVTRPGLDPELRDAQSCLRLLDRVWREPVGDSPELSPHTPRSLGRFQIERKLGEGGFGIVFLAHDPELGRKVALKVPHTAGLLSPELRRRFLNEARAAARLEHPYIVPVYDAGEIGALCYIVTAYCEGPTLADWLKEQTGPVPERTAAALVACLAEAIAYTHRQGILHRDLKPANILLVSGGVVSGEWSKQEEQASLPTTHHSLLTTYQPKITDFGLAKLLAGKGCDTTGTGTLLGTAPYMAPEQALGRSGDLGPSADVYALGVILYELLAGRPPFQGETPLETLDQVRTQEPVPPSRLRPKLSRDLETICLTCLRKAPHQRYADADALAADLACYLGGKPIQARPPSLVERSAMWIRRRPTVAALVAVSSAAVLCLLVGALWYGIQAGKHRLELQSALEREQRQATNAQNQGLRVEEGLRAEQHLYGTAVKLAETLWETGQFGSLTKSLHAQEPLAGRVNDLRGFEWHYLWGLAHRRGRQLPGNLAPVCAVAYSPDGKAVAAGSSNGVVTLWDTATWKVRASLRGHELPVVALAFAPDGKTLATGGGGVLAPGELKLWDVSTGKEQADLKGHRREIFCLAFSPDGRTLAVASANHTWGGIDDELKLWDVAKRQERASVSFYPGQSMCLSSLAFTPDGKTLFLGSTNGLVDWCNPSKQQLSKTFVRGPSNGAIHSIASSPDGNAIAAASEGGIVSVMALAKGAGDKTLRAPGVWSIQYAPDGKLLAAASRDGSVRLWDTATWQVLAAFTAHSGATRSIAFAPDGRTFVSGSEDGTVKIWDTRQVQGSLPLPGHQPSQAWAVALAPDGRTLASAGDDHTVRLWDLATMRDRAVLRGHGSLVTSVAFAPQEALVASGSFDNSVRLWDPATGREEGRLEGHTDKVRCVTFAPDGRTLASGSRDRTVRLWNVITRQRRQLILGHADTINALAYSPDGITLASVSNDGTIRLWNPDTGAELAVFPGDCPLMTVAFAADSKMLAAGNRKGEVVLWDLATGEKRVLHGHTGVVRSVTFSPDGKTLASASEDKTIKLWEPRTGLELLTLTGHANWVNGVAFSPDGSTLASACNDGSVRLWRGQQEDTNRGQP